MRRTGLRAALIAAALVLPVAMAAAAPVPASAAGGWTRIDGPLRAGQQLGLLRVGGLLHVIWSQGAPSTIHDTTFDADGHELGTVTVAAGFDGAHGLALLRLPDGSLRLFAAGGYKVNLPSSLVGINSFTASAAGNGWTRDASSLWGAVPASDSEQIGAALTASGEPVTAWGGGYVYVGLGRKGAMTSYQPDCCGFDPSLVRDASTGTIVMSWISIGHDAGTYVQGIYPAKGVRVSLPSGTNQRNYGSAARIGAPGVYVAFAENNGAVKLYRYGGPTIAIASGPFQLAKAFAGPGGRLWVAWGDDRDGLYVERSNRALTAFEPVQHLPMPPGQDTLGDAQGEGSAGPLDLFAFDAGASGQGYWHAHVLAIDTLHASVAPIALKSVNGASATQGAHITLSLSDAGDPVPGASIAISGDGATGHLKTDASGQATVTVTRSGTLTATATAPGYWAAALVAHVVLTVSIQSQTT